MIDLAIRVKLLGQFPESKHFFHQGLEARIVGVDPTELACQLAHALLQSITHFLRGFISQHNPALL
jgi:hypothetical protein